MTVIDTASGVSGTGGSDKVVSIPLERPPLRSRRRGSGPDAARLSHFIAGPENRLAAYVAGAQEDPFGFGNPLLFVGGTGVGKTSLALHFAALGANRRGSERGPATVLYLPAVDFARRYADAVDADDLDSLREEIDTIPVLVVDDIHLIQAKAASQGELASRIESRCLHGAPTVLTCVRLPPDVQGLRPRLVSRSLAGLTLPVRPPGPAARGLLLREYEMLQGIELTPDLRDSLERRLPADCSPRLIEASVKQIDLWCRIHRAAPSEEAIHAAVEAIGESRSVSIAAISNAVARHFRVKTADLKSGSRRQRLVRARSLAMWLARRSTATSLQGIGEYFGGRDHSTVLHAIRKTEASLDHDDELRRAAEELLEKLSA